MIVVDSSALVAVILSEPDSSRLEQLLVSRQSLIGAPNLFETRLVLSRRNPNAIQALDIIIATVRMEVAPFDAALVPIAQDAYWRFGKGRHPAALNFGDCMAYALAKSRDAPLLFKGNDFALTDIEAAI